MIIKGSLILVAMLLFSFSNNAQNKNEKRPVVLIKTQFGNVKVELYNETPKHRDNFLKLAKEGYYNGLLFHRVIKDFMVQGGDPDSRNAKPDQQLGKGGPTYTIDSEINPKFFHKKGALAAARTGDDINPERKSSGSQFYIVQGVVFPADKLPAIETERAKNVTQGIFNLLAIEYRDSLASYKKSGNQPLYDSFVERLKYVAIVKADDALYKLNEEQKRAYTTIGGSPHLDGSYTVFGEVVEGLNVIDSIASQPCGPNNRPKVDLKMEMKLIGK